MSDRSVTHHTFSLERTYDAPPAEVFGAFADAEAKSRWFVAPEGWEETVPHELDFRVGGREVNASADSDGVVHAYEARYYDIVPDARIVYAYEMQLDDVRISISLATIEVEPDGDRTHFTLTEQGAFLDGYDDVSRREQGTHGLLDALGEFLRR